MKTVKYLGYDGVVLENSSLRLFVTQSIGPRILSLSYKGSENIFAELPDSVSIRPDGRAYHFYGGHRLWLSPEDPMKSYGLDDQDVEILEVDDGLFVRKGIEPENGIEKTIHIKLDPDSAKLSLLHKLTNSGGETIEGAAWAITQFRPGGVAILPQAQDETGLLPNRNISLWPYSDVMTSNFSWGNRFILLRAEMDSPFKIGFSNPRGWLAYWVDGVLFVKHSIYDHDGDYGDFGSSSEGYCNQEFLELETISPIHKIDPGMSITHREEWQLYGDIEKPENEDMAQKIADMLDLG